MASSNPLIPVGPLGLLPVISTSLRQGSNVASYPCLSGRTKQLHNLLISRFLGKRLEGFSLRVTGGTKSREAAEESSNPFDVTAADGVGKVVQPRRQEPRPGIHPFRAGIRWPSRRRDGNAAR
jgi:hypothetical protein